MPASVFCRAQESGRAAAHLSACRPCRCLLNSSLIPAHGLAYVSSFHFSTSNPNFSVFSVQSTSHKASSFSRASQFGGNIDFYGMSGQNYFVFDKEKAYAWATVAHHPSTAARHPTCLEPPWLGGMFCAGRRPSCPFSAALPASSCRWSRGKPELAILTQGRCQRNTSDRALPWPPAVQSLSKAMNAVYCEPEVLPQSRSSHALRKGGNRPRRPFPSKVKESIPPPSRGEWEGGEDNSVISTSNAQSQAHTARHCDRVRALQRVAFLLNLVNIFEGKTPLCLWQYLYHHSVFTDAEPSFFHLEEKSDISNDVTEFICHIFRL